MKRSITIMAGLLAVGLPGPLSAQVERYDLGQRLQAFDKAWDEHKDPAARRRALPALNGALTHLFAGKFSDAAQALDQTRFLLRSDKEAVPAERWAAALVSRPSTRLLDPTGGPLAVEIRPYYDAKIALPDKAAFVATLLPADKAGMNAVAGPIAALPQKFSVPVDHLPQFDFTLRVTIVVDGKALATHEHTVSVVPRLRERVAAVEKAAAAAGPWTTERLTLKSLSWVVSTLAEKHTFETNFPGSRLVAGGEALAKAVQGTERYYGPKRSGQFWLSLATDKKAAPVRVFVPPGLTAEKPAPLVVAMHGLGGSENLFFDAYGNGAIVRLCQERGWLLVATRSAGFGDLPPVAGIIDELARLYPVDQKRVFLVGHSMGASQAIDVAQAAPGRIAAVAALGGGGSVRNAEAIKGLPVFVGCGKDDIALVWVRALIKALETAEAKITVKEYPDVEHIAIVQDALKDVFAFFEKKKAD